MTFETFQLVFAALTALMAILFLVAYLPERPFRNWFAASLVLIAIAVLGYTMSIVLFRVLGPDYPLRAFIVISSSLLTFAAMTMRTVVLLIAQYRDNRGVGSWLINHLLAPVRYFRHKSRQST